MSKFFILIVSAVAVFSAFSCASSKEKEKAAIEELVKNNAALFVKEDLVGYIATLDPESPEIADTKVMMAELFSKYDLKINIESVRVLKVNEDKADVEVDQVTEKVTGGDFRNNRVKIVHHLKKINGAWKIYGSDTIRIEYFDQANN